MRYTIGMVLIVMLAGCANDSYLDEQGNTPESVLVLCDSMSGVNEGWPEQLQEMAGVPVHKECLGGARLATYALTAQDNPPLEGGTYAVLQLGGWDVLAGWPVADIQQEYSDALDSLYNSGYSPICYTYPNGSSMPRTDALKLFNAHIMQMCNDRGYPVIISSEQIMVIHYNDAGVAETAVNAWRVLFPEGSQ